MHRDAYSCILMCGWCVMTITIFVQYTPFDMLELTCTHSIHADLAQVSLATVHNEIQSIGHIK